MVVVKAFQLPSDEELDIQELNISYPYIHAAAVFLGKKCEWFNNEFMLCRSELKDPRKCLKEGKDVTNCALSGLQDIKKHCRMEFETYVDCILDTSQTLDDSECKKTRALFDECMLKKLNMERPPFGYFCETKVHDSPRPKPTPQEELTFPEVAHEPVPPPYRQTRQSTRGHYGI